MEGATLPKIHRAKETRLRFSRPVLTETTAYKVVAGFGNSMHFISKDGGPNFQLHQSTERTLYPSQIKDRQAPTGIKLEINNMFIQKQINIPQEA